jgi:hypothetical protein
MKTRLSILNLICIAFLLFSATIFAQVARHDYKQNIAAKSNCLPIKPTQFSGNEQFSVYKCLAAYTMKNLMTIPKSNGISIDSGFVITGKCYMGLGDDSVAPPNNYFFMKI